MGSDPKKPLKKGFKVNDQRWWLKEGADLDEVPDQPEISKPTYVEELEAQLAEKDKTLREYIQAHKSSVTGMDETRVRLERDLDRRLDVERANLAGPFVEVLDNLMRLYAAAEGNPEMAQGTELVIKQLSDELSKIGLEPIVTQGCRFDPKVMEALMTAEVPEDQDGMVLEEVRPGYMLKEQVVRPAGVRVGVARKG
jgi:molecular chaperone GrpE